MFTIDQMEVMLDEIAEEIPQACYKDLNGGILLLPDLKWHPGRRSDDLYIMGEYHNSPIYGKYIVIYYGSFRQAYGHLPEVLLRKQLKKTLCHEFLHHLETLAGVRDLAKKDAEDMKKYLQRYDR